MTVKQRIKARRNQERANRAGMILFWLGMLVAATFAGFFITLSR